MKEAVRALERSGKGKSAEPRKMAMCDFIGFVSSHAEVFPQLATLFMCALTIPVRPSLRSGDD